MSLYSTNPVNQDVFATYDEMSPAAARKAVVQAQQAFVQWQEISFSERALLMHNAAATLRDRKETFAKLMAAEMGKAIREGRAEIEKCAWVCDYYADNAANFLADKSIASDAGHSYVSFRPLGVVLAVMPWNFPFWQVFRFAAPNLMAGNAGVLKHASNVPGCALAIEDLFRVAGFPHHLFRSLMVGSKKVAALIRNPLIKAVTLTGSTPAGKAVAKNAGLALKKTVLELGGSDPYIILEDADLDAAVADCVTAKMINAGQSCIAAKRLIVVNSVRTAFESKLVTALQAKRMGDPLDEKTDYGPQARVDLRDELHLQVQQSINAGARCLLGGTIPQRSGAFYPATVLTDVKAGMPAFDQELFGPVASIIVVKSETEAIHVANDTCFGLGAAVFTKDKQRGERIAKHALDAGCCFVNGFVKSDPRLPFGGIKQSGYGRELGAHGIREFVNVKTVWVR